MNTAGKTCFVRLKQWVMMFLNLLFRGKICSYFPGPEENQERRSCRRTRLQSGGKCEMQFKTFRIVLIGFAGRY